MRSTSALSLVASILVLALVACNDDNGEVTKDGSGSDIDGAVTDGNGTVTDGNGTGEGTGPGDGPGVADARGDGAGWIVYDGGPIQVYDGGIVITEDSGNTVICYETACGANPQECGDCIDNDQDGFIDWRDPECLGPCDNTEGPGLESGVGGTTGASCGVDCYFDYGNGPGNDDCQWSHKCDALEPELPACTYDQTMVGGTKCPAAQSQQCLGFCLPYTPNGCDCFGCCTFPDLTGTGPGGADVYVWIGAMDTSNVSTCTLATVTDPLKCPPCTPVMDCLNTCGKCEVCVGKPMPPPECFQQPEAGPGDLGLTDGPPPTLQCPGGEQPCGLPGQAPCAPTHYCISGCCIEVNID